MRSHARARALALAILYETVSSDLGAETLVLQVRVQSSDLSCVHSGMDNSSDVDPDGLLPARAM